MRDLYTGDSWNKREEQNVKRKEIRLIVVGVFMVVSVLKEKMKFKFNYLKYIINQFVKNL